MDGRFTLRHMPNGTVAIRIYAAGFESERIEITLVPGETRDLGTIVLTRASATLKLRLQLPTGIDPSGWQVVLLRRDDNSRPLQTEPRFDAEGLLTVSNVPEGEYQVGARPVKGGKVVSTFCKVSKGETMELNLVHPNAESK